MLNRNGIINALTNLWIDWFIFFFDLIDQFFFFSIPVSFSNKYDSVTWSIKQQRSFIKAILV